MVRYYCPYCNPKYQFQKQSSKGNLICGLCGEDLVKKPFIRLNQIIALVAASSLLLPLIYTFIFLIKNQINPPNKEILLHDLKAYYLPTTHVSLHPPP